MGDSDPGDVCLGWETLREPVETEGRPQWWEAGLAEGLHRLHHRGPLSGRTRRLRGREKEPQDVIYSPTPR